MTSRGYFNAERDSALIAAGTHFWCQTCFVARPLDDRSPDERYCQACYCLLSKEAEMLGSHVKEPDWIPGKLQKIEGKKLPPIPQGGGGNMATVKGDKSEVAIIKPVTSKVTHGKRGPKYRGDLPLDLISQWQSEGMGSKAIARRLNAEYGIKVGFRTVARILSGQRVLV